MSQHEIFANYELNNSKWTALILKFVTGSILLHFVVLASAIYIPGIRDAFYVALLFDPDRQYVNKSYNLGEIADDVTIINVANPDRFRYPEGYFNTGEYIAPDPTLVSLNGDPSFGGAVNDFSVPPPGFESVTPNPTINVPPPPPPPMSFPSVSKRSSGGLPPLPRPKKGAKVKPLEPVASAEADGAEKPKTPPTPNPTDVAKNAEPLKEGEINRQPLIDFGQKVDKLQKEGKVDMNQPFAVVVEAELDKNGKLLNPATTQKSGDKQLTDLTKEMILVLNASGVLRNLSDLTKNDTSKKTHKVKFDVSQDQTNVTVSVALEFDDESLANRIQSGANTIVSLTKNMRKDKIEGQLLENVSISTNGKQVIFNSIMPRQAAEKLIQDQLATAVKQPANQAKQ
ncbi:MAG TPA: hypothetical protein VEX64_12210 [Pyrinomonadaceae bacterium]|jgi:hypothetical protein|nr:hypothetical protein [Pyrinomonadaceae bacterium]